MNPATAMGFASSGDATGCARGSARRRRARRPIESPPNFSRTQRASSKATTASPTTAAAAIAVVSLRSTSASAGLVRVEARRAQRPHQRRQRLHRHAHDDGLPVRHAALDAARAVALAPVAARLVEQQLVVHGRPGLAGVCERVADLDALHGLDAHGRGRQASVQAQPGLGVRAETGRAAEGADLDDAAERVAVGRRLVDRGEHALLARRDRSSRSRSRGRVRRPPRRLRPAPASTSPTASTRPKTAMPSSASRPFVIAPTATRAEVSRAEARSSTLRTSSSSYFMTPERSAWPGRGSCTLRLRRAATSASSSSRDRPRAHGGAPVGVVAVAHDQRQRPAEREAVAHAAEDLDVVLLDALPRAAAVAGLTPRQIGADRVVVEREPRGQAGDDRGDPGTVRLAGGDVAQLHGAERRTSQSCRRRAAASASRSAGSGSGSGSPSLGELRSRSTSAPRRWAAVLGDGHDAPAREPVDLVDDLHARADHGARAVVEVDVDQVAAAVGRARAQGQAALRDVDDARPDRGGLIARALGRRSQAAGDARQRPLLAEQLCARSAPARCARGAARARGARARGT